MSNLIATITDDINSEVFTSCLVDMVPWLLIIIPVAFTLNLIRKSITGGADGKVRL